MQDYDHEKYMAKKQMEKEERLKSLKVVTCPKCSYRMMYKFWSKLKKGKLCPECGSCVSTFKLITEEKGKK